MFFFFFFPFSFSFRYLLEMCLLIYSNLCDCYNFLSLSFFIFFFSLFIWAHVGIFSAFIRHGYAEDNVSSLSPTT